MPKYYLLGGENIHKRDAEVVNQRAFNDAGANPRVLVFSWARASFDKAYPKAKIVFDYFRSLGASTVNVVDYSLTNSEIKAKLAEADLVYITGGVPSVLLERLKKLRVDVLLKDFDGVVIGRSAGALALCRKCVITYRSSGEVKVIDGLGLVDLTFKAHYKVANDEPLLKLSQSQDIYAVPKGSAVVCENGKLSFLGSTYLFSCGIRQQLS
jgi:dipeptidase E